MGTLLVAAQIEKFITVADNAFPLLLKQGFELCQILQDNRNGHATGAHHAQNLIEVIWQ